MADKKLSEKLNLFFDKSSIIFNNNLRGDDNYDFRTFT
jgi:hypothetical protein